MHIFGTTPIGHCTTPVQYAWRPQSYSKHIQFGFDSMHVWSTKEPENMTSLIVPSIRVLIFQRWFTGMDCQKMQFSTFSPFDHFCMKTLASLSWKFPEWNPAIGKAPTMNVLPGAGGTDSVPAPMAGEQEWHNHEIGPPLPSHSPSRGLGMYTDWVGPRTETERFASQACVQIGRET